MKRVLLYAVLVSLVLTSESFGMASEPGENGSESGMTGRSIVRQVDETEETTSRENSAEMYLELDLDNASEEKHSITSQTVPHKEGLYTNGYINNGFSAFCSTLASSSMSQQLSHQTVVTFDPSATDVSIPTTAFKTMLSAALKEQIDESPLSFLKRYKWQFATVAFASSTFLFMSLFIVQTFF